MSIKWFDVKTCKDIDVYGMSREDFTRLPHKAAALANENVVGNSFSPAGGRIRFSTDSEKIYIKTEITATRGIGFDLYSFQNGCEIFAAGFRNADYFIADGTFEAETHPIGVDGSMRSYTLNFPYFGNISSFLLGIDDGCTLTRGAEYVNEKPVAFYGSSITHGAWVTRPGCAYISLISQKYNLNYLNFGFSGSARGEKPFIEYLAKLPISAFVSDYDHNAY